MSVWRILQVSNSQDLLDIERPIKPGVGKCSFTQLFLCCDFLIYFCLVGDGYATSFEKFVEAQLKLQEVEILFIIYDIVSFSQTLLVLDPVCSVLTIYYTDLCSCICVPVSVCVSCSTPVPQVHPHPFNKKRTLPRNPFLEEGRALPDLA